MKSEITTKERCAVFTGLAMVAITPLLGYGLFCWIDPQTWFKSLVLVLALIPGIGIVMSAGIFIMAGVGETIEKRHREDEENK